jgi:hypothetical protein
MATIFDISSFSCERYLFSKQSRECEKSHRDTKWNSISLAASYAIVLSEATLGELSSLLPHVAFFQAKYSLKNASWERRKT